MTTETEPRIHCVHCKREAAEQRARIRELEAGLLGCRQARSELEWKCARLARLAQLANEATARAEKAEARVAELEGTERETRLGPHNAHLQDDEQIRGCPECDKEHYAREREAD